ncbi:LysM peptidoglycan-binding domain-containing protein [Salinicoccus carnicancri]|uniref:LysM peptidoglycan-binding domain-containing protein n=1 Tax=Salinicoccus carnicancri TaxID=558170 RepID=UPI0003193D6C|nr:LysM peptidoglycan-binding domain-containing protein [Salinicoccus carnicancri]
MKDDFYKDIEHKRTSKDVEEAKNESQKDEQQQTMKRSDRHRAKLEKKNEKDRQKQGAPSKTDKKKSGLFAGSGQKLNSYFNRKNLEKGKVFFAGKFSSYKRRFKDEVRVSKSKLSELGSRRQSPAKEKGEDKEQKKGVLPILLGGALLLPVTIILFVMIISNFWPSGDNATDLAGAGEEETEESSGDQGSGDVNEDLESQKAEKERELAEQRENESGSDAEQDLGTGELDADYSEEEQSELEEAASSAIEEKESGEDSGPDTSEVESSEEEATEEPTEEETQEQPTEEQTEEQAESEEPAEDNASGGSTHVVSAEDNLYRIAIRYYGSGSSENVNKIMDANGVTPDSLSVGQELVIPE